MKVISLAGISKNLLLILTMSGVWGQLKIDNFA